MAQSSKFFFTARENYKILYNQETGFAQTWKTWKIQGISKCLKKSGKTWKNQGILFECNCFDFVQTINWGWPCPHLFC